MDRGTFLRRALVTSFVIAAASALPSCEYGVTGYTQQPKTLTTCDLDEVRLRVRWARDVDEIAKACHRGRLTGGCTERIEYINGERWAFLVVLKPKDFNDVAVLAYLGHEACHALGGTHE